jgi:hypothetical protein
MGPMKSGGTLNKGERQEDCEGSQPAPAAQPAMAGGSVDSEHSTPKNSVPYELELLPLSGSWESPRKCSKVYQSG